MQNSISKIAVVVLVMIAFIGQAFADLTMSCEMQSQHSGHHMTPLISEVHKITTSGHGHENHSASKSEHHAADTSEAQNAEQSAHMNHHSGDSHEDCCETDCFCPASACSSASIVNSNLSTSNFIQINDGVVSQSNALVSSILSSLYRPPIFA